MIRNTNRILIKGSRTGGLLTSVVLRQEPINNGWVSIKLAFERLEPYAVKVASTVLRGASPGQLGRAYSTVNPSLP